MDLDTYLSATQKADAFKTSSFSGKQWMISLQVLTYNENETSTLSIFTQASKQGSIHVRH